MNQQDIEAINEEFHKECLLINMEEEYGASRGFKEKWGIASILTKEEILAKYAKVIDKYIPFIWLDSESGEVIADYHRNDEKFKKRQQMYMDAFGIDDDFEYHHPECTKETVFTDDYEKAEIVKDALNRLPAEQKKIIILYFYYGFNTTEIAEKIGISSSGVRKSKSRAEKKLEIFLSKESRLGLSHSQLVKGHFPKKENDTSSIDDE